MITTAELESAFKTHFEEMERCEQHQCYLALLHLIVVLPDICGALSARDGEATGKRYRGWCDLYWSNDRVSSKDRYAIKNALLHQGKTFPPKQRSTTYSFNVPPVNGMVVHQNVCAGPSGNHLQLDIGELKKEVLGGARKWFQALEESVDSRDAKNVNQHLATMARRDTVASIFIQGVNFSVHHSRTPGSPWEVLLPTQSPQSSQSGPSAGEQPVREQNRECDSKSGDGAATGSV